MSFWDRRAAHFEKVVADDDAAVMGARRYLRSDHEVLEIGCAVGATARALRPMVQSWTGVDLSEEMVRIAMGEGGDIAYQQGTISEAPAGPYDVVVACNVLHFMDLETDLAEVHHRLKPGGLLVAQTPCLGDMNRLLRLLFPLVARLIRLPGLNRLRFDELRSQVEADFEILEATGTPATQTWLVARRRPE